MGLHLAAQISDHFLRGFREQLRQREGSEPLNHGGGEDRQDDGSQQTNVVFADDVVDQIFCGGRQDQAGHAVHGHQQQSRS